MMQNCRDILRKSLKLRLFPDQVKYFIAKDSDPLLILLWNNYETFLFLQRKKIFQVIS